MRIRKLSKDDLESLLAFENTNRAWFEKYIEARPEQFYSHDGVASHIDELLEAAEKGNLFPGVIDENEFIIGRVNLTKMEGSTKAKLGYRISASCTGRGVATFGVGKVLEQAPLLNISAVSAFVSLENRPSHQVLRKHGFVPVAEHPNHALVAGRLFTCIEYERALA